LPTRSTAQFFFLIIAFLTSCFTLGFCEGTRSWEQSRFEEFTKGTARGVAIRSNGELELAPAFKALCTTPSTYIWALASDSAGNVYAAAGSPARVYRITPDGQATTIFEPQELQVQALVVDNKGVLYAGTAPDGKVYRIAVVPPPKAPGAEKTKAEPTTPQWSASVYFDPKTKYIWDMLIDHGGNLFVATGDHGEIYRIAANGTGSLFFKSDEVHIRRIALDPNGSLIAGSDGSGLVYRISPSGQGFVLYSAPKKEITALAIDKSGNIYAAASGEKRAGASGQSITVTSISPSPSALPAGTQPTIAVGATPPVAGNVPFPAPGLGATAGSEIYRIAPDGSPTRIWTSREDLVYALSFDGVGRLIVGSGNRGHIFSIRGEDDFTDLVKASATQVTAFAAAPGGLYVSTSNLGKLFLLGSEPEAEGTYESDVFDTKIFSRFGRADLRATGNVTLYARSGNVDNPDRNWSPWAQVKNSDSAEIGVPAARYVQWKAVLQNGPVVPRVDSVLLYYLPKNVAPDIDDINVLAGIRYQTPPHTSGSGSDSTSGVNSAQRPDNPIPSVRDRESIGVKWNVHDDNDDQMVYSLYYRGEKDSRWLLLKDEIYDKAYSFDASLLPDGAYLVKVVASDAPSHSPGESLTTEKESSRFEVDTTPPQISGLTASVDNDKIRVRFRAVDGYSPIKRAEYSVDAGDWQYLEPTGQLSDSVSEDYDFNVAINTAAPQPATLAKTAPSQEKSSGKKSKTSAPPPQPPFEHVVVVRVYDRFENMSSAKAVIRPQTGTNAQEPDTR
jgi:hypothetical protein